MNEKEPNSEIENLITKSLTGEITSSQKAELEQWISEDPSHAKFFQQMKKSYDLSGRLSRNEEELDIDVNAEWSRFQNEIARKTEKLEDDSKQRSINIVWKIAAAVLLVVASGLVVNYFTQQNQAFEFKAEAVPIVVSLPDGSQVSLNRNSSLSYTRSFGDEDRRVSLKGEAFFNVTPNKQKPFVISTNGAQVRVLGTSFNVKGGTNEVEVIVETGLVRLSAADNSKSVDLEPGDRGSFRGETGTIKKESNEDVNYLAWKTKKIIFENAGLERVAEVIEKVYGIDVVISIDVSPECEVTVMFDNQSLDAVLAVLESTLNLTYKREKNKIEIVKAGC
ncbi:MAG: FecR domain-containing protein [Cyclobacteriaceae bacterium]|nr:FecR domain-containing protein [Cyclobacteriaceae bacterium]